MWMDIVSAFSTVPLPLVPWLHVVSVWLLRLLWNTVSIRACWSNRGARLTDRRSAADIVVRLSNLITATNVTAAAMVTA